MKKVVVTGGAKGIGKAICEDQLKRGNFPILLDLDEKNARLNIEKWSDQFSVTVDFIKADVTDWQSMEDAAKQIEAQHGKIDTLVVNAGISHMASFDELDPTLWQRTIDINLTGAFYTTKAFYGHFTEHREKANGRIIFITSGSAITGTGGGAHYAASKAGNHGLMRALSKELKGTGTTVNAIAPRVIVTELFDDLYPDSESRERILSAIPVGRFGTPSDVASLVGYLSSDEASYIHGQILLLDGGRTY